MRERVGVWLLSGLWSVMPVCGASAAAQMEVPLPKGVVAVSEAQQVDLGRGTLEVETFTTDLSEQALIEFFDEALPASGWEPELLPWQAHQAVATARLERILNEHRDGSKAPQLEARLEQMQDSAHAMRRQLYASNGQEHVIVNLMPMEDGIAVFINRWSGDRSWMGAAPREVRSASAASGRKSSLIQVDSSQAVYRGSAQPSWNAADRDLSADPSTNGADGGASGLPTNVCCSGEEVPELARALPFSVPKYPHSRAVSRSRPRGGERTTILLMSSDAADDIAAYYRRQMPLNGWEPLGERGALLPGPEAQGLVLRYAKPDRLCDITLTRVTDADEARASPQRSASAIGAGDGQAPRTMITVALLRRGPGASGRFRGDGVR